MRCKAMGLIILGIGLYFARLHLQYCADPATRTGLTRCSCAGLCGGRTIRHCVDGVDVILMHIVGGKRAAAGVGHLGDNGEVANIVLLTGFGREEGLLVGFTTCIVGGLGAGNRLISLRGPHLVWAIGEEPNFTVQLSPFQY